MAEEAPIAWPVYKLFDQLHRYVVAYMLIHNYYAWSLHGAAAPTLTALQKIAGSSPRQTAGFVAALRAGQFVTIAPEPGDRRTKLLRPEPAMVAEIGRSARLFLAALDEIQPELPPRHLYLADPERMGDLMRGSAAAVLADGTLLHGFPRVLHFAERDCGYPLLTAVLGAHLAETTQDSPPALPLSLRALAQRFQVSPAHIGNLLAEAERAGWFTVRDGGRLVEVADDFCAEFEHWSAGQMAHFEALLRETERFFAGKGAAA
ncbi:MAG: hypothetical protein B7Z15_16375 [Rhizobiales bacterium 32-66-8]|nr:MAG: hypothetical protein B7Z15_16375 [Rhizobiales bacterium 32-66-8]